MKERLDPEVFRKAADRIWCGLSWYCCNALGVVTNHVGTDRYIDFLWEHAKATADKKGDGINRPWGVWWYETKRDSYKERDSSKAFEECRHLRIEALKRAYKAACALRVTEEQAPVLEKLADEPLMDMCEKPRPTDFYRGP